MVDIENCNNCHVAIGLHGGTRNDPNYCVMCHNPNLDTSGRMALPAPGDLDTSNSVSLARLVHRIHTGENAESEYTLWGHTGSPVTFDEVRYPADRRECTRCHVDEASYDLPLSPDLLPARTVTLDSAGAVASTNYTPPTTNACVGCHDAPATLAHAETMTTALGAEACASCHASGSSFGMDVVHARPEYAFRP